MYEVRRGAILSALLAAAVPWAAWAQDAPPGPRAAPSASAAPRAETSDSNGPAPGPGGVTPKGADAESNPALDELGPPPPAPGEEAAPAPAPAPSGDVVTMKNGKVLQGVQVVSETPMKVTVQVVPGVDPIEIPRKQVVSIDYDDLRPEDIKEGAPAAGAALPPGMRKGETSSELSQKLGKPVTEEDLKVQQRDVVEVLTEFANKVEVPIEMQPEVQKLPPVERRWNGTITGGTSLMSVLLEALPKDFPQLEAEITADRVIIKMKAEGEAAQ